MPIDVEDNKGFCKCIGDKTKSRKNVGSLLNKMGEFIAEDMKVTEVVNVP